MPRTATTPRWIERGPLQRQIFCWSCGLCVLMVLLGWAATGSHVTINLDRGKPHATALHLHNHRFLLFTEQQEWYLIEADEYTWPKDFLPNGTPIVPTPFLPPLPPQQSTLAQRELFTIWFDTMNESKAHDTLGTPMYLSVVASSPWSVVLMAACVAMATRPRRVRPWPAPRPWLTRIGGRWWPVSWFGTPVRSTRPRSSRWKHRSLLRRTIFWCSIYGLCLTSAVLFVSTHCLFVIELCHNVWDEPTWTILGYGGGHYSYRSTSTTQPIISESRVAFLGDGSWEGHAMFFSDPFSIQWTPLWNRSGSIALWIPPLVFLIPLLLTLPRRVRAGQCRCGYSLIGLASPKCPECGRTVSRVNAPTNIQSQSTTNPPATASENTP